jgi:AraC-like DNA-binding protein
MLGTRAAARLSDRGVVLDCGTRAATLAPGPVRRYPAPMGRNLSTDSVDAPRRTAYWTDMVCDTYVQLECDAPAGVDSIEGHIVADRLATLDLSRVTSTAQTVRRTAAKIGQAAEDYFLVSIQTQGHGIVSQDGRDALLAPGDFALYDSTRPYTLRFDSAFQQMVLMLPGPVLRTAVRDTHRLTATRVGSERGAGHLMINMITTLAQDIDTLAPASASAVADGVTQILVAGLSTLAPSQPPPSSALAALHLQQIKALVRRHCLDPDFGVARIASSLRVSASTVHRVWSSEPCSITDWVWSLRLDAARSKLGDPSFASWSISRIAFECGFNDAAHFSRVFKARFGCSPRESRHELIAPARADVGHGIGHG